MINSNPNPNPTRHPNPNPDNKPTKEVQKEAFDDANVGPGEEMRGHKRHTARIGRHTQEICVEVEAQVKLWGGGSQGQDIRLDVCTHTPTPHPTPNPNPTPTPTPTATPTCVS